MSETKTRVVELGPLSIRTAEDAKMAYLREEINLKEFEEACVKFGVLPGHFVSSTEPVDYAFSRSLPEELTTVPPLSFDSLETRQKAVAAKDKERAAASKASKAK